MRRRSSSCRTFCVVHVGDQNLRFFAELVDLLRLPQVLKETFLVRVALELFNQLLDLVFAICILLFDRRKGYDRNSVVNGAVPGFPGTLQLAGLVTRCSCVLFSLIWLTAVRIRFEYNPWQSWSKAYLVIELLLRFHAYCCLNANGGQCVAEFDCMRSCLVKLQSCPLIEL